MEKNKEIKRLKFINAPSFAVWNRVQAVRKYVGLTQDELAELACTSYGSVWRIENDQDAHVSRKLKVKVMEGLNVKLKDINLRVEFQDLYPAKMIGNFPAADYRGPDITGVDDSSGEDN